MQVDIALCQIRPMTGSPEMNAETVANMIVSRDEQVLIFPESFLTGYGVSPEGLEERISAALTTISDTCRKYDKAVAVGTPMPSPEGWTNSLAFLSPDGDSYYDKIHLARFGVYAEDGYVAGRKPSTFGSGTSHRQRSAVPAPKVEQRRPAAAKAAEVFAPGDTVRHKTFGTGTVITASGYMIEVKFEKTGQVKKLMKGFAPIVKVD